MKTTNLKNRWLLHLLSAAIMTIGLTACSGSDDKVDEPLKPDTKITDSDWQNIPVDGGTIEKGDITIQFPSGTFSSDTKVAVSEVKKGQIFGEDEVSKFYQVTMPLSIAKSLSVKIKCEEKGNDINAVVHVPSRAISENREFYCDMTLESSYSNGTYTMNIPVSDSNESTDNVSFSLGIAKMARVTDKISSTRAEQKVDNIKWHIDVRNIFFYYDYYENINKISEHIREALTTLKSLGFKPRGNRDIPIIIGPMQEDGTFNQNKVFDAWSSVSINDQQFLKNYKDNESKLKRTLIHELMHFYQAEYDPRFTYIKAITGGDESILYESVAVWAEKLNDGGAPSSDFIAQYLPTFIRGMDDLKGVWNNKINYAHHGYGAASLIEYLTTKRSSEGFNKNSVVEIFEMWKKETTFLGTAFPGTSLDYLKYWADKHHSKFFVGDNYDDFVLKLMTGEVLPGVTPNNLYSQTDAGKLTIDGKLEFKGKCYPYGAFINKVQTTFGDEYNAKGSLKNKQLVIDQKEDDAQTYVVALNKNGTKLIEGKATKDSPLIISGETLESLRVGDNYTVYFYPASTNRSNQTTVNSNITVELKEQDFAITKITEIEFNSNLKMRDVETGKEVKYSKTLSKFDKCTIKQNGSTIHVECSFDEHEDYGKSGYNITTRSLSFDIVGFTEDTYGDKYGRIFCNVKNLKCSDYWKRDYGDNMVSYSIWEYEWEISNMNPQYGSDIGYLTFGGEWSHGFFTLDKFSYKETSKDWNKPERSHTYSIIEDGDNIIALKIEYEYTTKKK